MFQHSVRQSVYANSLTVDYSATIEGDVEVAINQTVVASGTNVEVLVAIDVSALKSIILKSSNAATVKTNSGGSPDDTISLEANVPYVWNTESYEALALGTDVTKIFITNSAGTEMTFQLLALTDTP